MKYLVLVILSLSLFGLGACSTSSSGGGGGTPKGDNPPGQQKGEPKGFCELDLQDGGVLCGEFYEANITQQDMETQCTQNQGTMVAACRKEGIQNSCETAIFILHSYFTQSAKDAVINYCKDNNGKTF